MKKEILLFQKEELSFKNKFFLLMDLLINNQVESRFEAFLLLGIFYIQIIFSFFTAQIEILDYKNSKSDKLLNYIHKLFRFKGLFRNNYEKLTTFLIIFFFIFLLVALHFIFCVSQVSKTSYYSINLKFINFYIKIFMYVLYNIIFDMGLSLLCFGQDDYNLNFNSIKCSDKKNPGIIFVAIIYVLLALVLYNLLSIFYNDSFFLSNSYYSKMTCNYDIFMGFNCFAISILSTQVQYLTKEIFLLYNLIISIYLFRYYLKHYLYYDKYINVFTGIFHILYTWTSIFCLIFAYLDLREKGIIYIFTSIIVCYFYFNIKNILENKIFMDTPYYKIANKYYVLFYLRNIIDKINNVEQNYEDKSFLSSIIQIHSIECPNIGCLLRTNEEIYLPISNKWSDKKKKKVDDEAFLKNFIVIIMNYFISTHDCSVDMYLNLSLYELKVIGNYCQAMYYYQKVLELKLSLKEYFSLIRLHIQISKALLEKLKPPNEQCPELENLNISQYYKYDSLSQSFIEEINNDVNLSLEFWNSFLKPLKEINKKVDFNKVFKLTDKIRITKKNIENMWNELLKIYDGVNDFFQIYMDYIEQINDDDLKRRDLEVLRRKNENIGEHINMNFYYILFSKETGIIIANGDKGNEGIIQLANNQIENIFQYNPSDLKGMNISCLMPKMFAKDHSKYMARYFKIGEKKYMDKSIFLSFGRDKNNYIIKLKIAIKLFPILNENVYFCTLIIKENIDDMILLDNQYIIQGMSPKLMKILGINNIFLFQENDIPFYVICKKFVNFYNIFLKVKKKSNSIEQKLILEEEKKENKDEKEEKENIHDNIEINENVELEYEIKLPQFLIDYAEKSNKKESKNVVQLMGNNLEEEKDIDELNDDSDESENLLKTELSNKSKTNNKSQKIENNNKNNLITPTPGQTPTPTPTPNPDEKLINNNSSLITNSINSNEKDEKNIEFKKYSKEEKIYKNTMNQYKLLFSEDKIDELEELIDSCNKNSSSIEYKFNFTFDKHKYGNKQLSYIVRCIETKNDIGNSEEESDIDPNPLIDKYKKEKNKAIKPLFELLEEEKMNIIKLPEDFLKLSLENNKFQKLLSICKNDIINISKVYGHKKDQVLEDENSSQSSQAGFDSGLLKKNRIEEIRSNVMKNISSFYTLKYIKGIIILIAMISVTFSSLYLFYFKVTNFHLKKTFNLNINLYQTTLFTSELINLFISLRVLYNKHIIYNNTDFDFYDFLANNYNNNLIESNRQYYNNYISYSHYLYNKVFSFLGNLEMELPNYLNERQLKDIFWDSIKITYMVDLDYNLTDLYPLSLSQFLSNVLSYIEDLTYNTISEVALNRYTQSKEKNYLYFEYMTYLIIENGYNNILPNQIEKLTIIPNILLQYNLYHKKNVIGLIVSYMCIILCLNCLFYVMFFATGKSMMEGMIKFTKIRIEKIEEIIKKIKFFSVNLKKFKEKNLKIFDDVKNNIPEISLKENNLINEGSNNSLIKEEIKKKFGEDSSIVNNSGFNIDYKKYVPLKILNNLVYIPVFFFIFAFLSLIPIYALSLRNINNNNLLLLVQKYLYGKLIQTSNTILDIKCFMSNCIIKKKLNSSSLVNMNQIQKIIEGINILPAISEYYNEKFLLNACSAAINMTKSPEDYFYCLSDPVVLSANNSDNLIKLIKDFADNIKKEYEIRNDSQITVYETYKLFNSTNFYLIEYIENKYIFGIQEIFTDLLINEHKKYLEHNEFLVYTVIIFLGFINLVYCSIYGMIVIKKLINYLTISRCIMKIIPISAILNTQELETWIENKY